MLGIGTHGVFERADGFLWLGELEEAVAHGELQVGCVGVLLEQRLQRGDRGGMTFGFVKRNGKLHFQHRIAGRELQRTAPFADSFQRIPVARQHLRLQRVQLH
jgi:hypothetical protein